MTGWVAATFAVVALISACSGRSAFVSSDADYQLCKQQTAQHHALLRQVVEPIAGPQADGFDYGDACDSAFDGAYLMWSLPEDGTSAKVFQQETDRFREGGWEPARDADLEPGEVLLEKSVEGADYSVLLTCDTGGDTGPCEAWAAVEN